MENRDALFSYEAEMATLNYLLTTSDTSTALDALKQLRADYYANPDHQAIFQIISKVYAERGADPIFLLEKNPTIQEQAMRIMQATSLMDAKRFRNAVDALHDSFERRIVESVGQRMVAMVKDATVKDVYVEAMGLLAGYDVIRPKSDSDSYIESIIEGYLKGNGSIIGKVSLSSGYERFDKVLRGDLVGIYGEENAERFHFAMNLALRYLDGEEPLNIYSLNHTKRQVFEQLLSIHSDVGTRHVRARHVMTPDVEQEVMKSIKVFKEFDLEIHDDKRTLSDLVNDLTRAKARRNIKVAFIEGLDRMFNVETARTLKALSQDLNLPIFTTFDMERWNPVSDEFSTLLELANISESRYHDTLNVRFIKNEHGPSMGFVSFSHESYTGVMSEKDPVTKGEILA